MLPFARLSREGSARKARTVRPPDVFQPLRREGRRDPRAGGVAVVEALERRQMFSAGASIAGNVLIVYGDNDNESISVLNSGSNVSVTVDDNNGNSEGDVSGLGFAKANFTSIKIYGYGGSDTIWLINAATDTFTCQIYGGEEDDDITADVVSCTIYGEGGNDVITGSTHNDSIFGGTGADTIYVLASGGNDYVDGGSGTDTVHDNDVNDTVVNVP